MKRALPVCITLAILIGMATTDCVGQKTVVDGKRLAQTYCQSCHVQPAPNDLDKTTWVAKVFPMMRRYMGLDPLPQHDVLPHDLKALYPTAPMMTEDEWFTVAQWYIDNAPIALEPPAAVNVRGTISVFTNVLVKNIGTIPMTTFATFDATSGGILLGDALANAVHVVDTNGAISSAVPIGGPPSHVALRGNRWYVTSMGKLLPHDSAVGALVEITWSADTKGSYARRTLIDSLRRPTHVLVEDLNGDGQDDFLVCEFGNLIGQFGWYEVFESGRTKYHQLSPLPGAIRAVIHDMNGDRRPDILVQMAQSRESIVLYTNMGSGKFTSREILTFPPSRGSSSFRLVNVDTDSAMEILYTAGDNGDYDLPPYKPYHGVYIFDQTPGGWKQTMFQRLDGAYGAWLADFSGDGKPDLFSFSYFPRFDRGDYDLVRFDQDVLTSSPTAWRVSGASSGRWLVSDIADIDGDGDLDVLLGNVSIGPGIVPENQAVAWTSGGILAMILRNTTR